MDYPLPSQGIKTTLSKLKNNRKLLLATAGIILIIISVFWQTLLSPAGDSVKVATASRGDIEAYVSAPAKVLLPSRASLNFKTSGRIQAVYVKAGDEVMAGQILAELDMTSIYPQIDQAEAGLKIAKANLQKVMSGHSRADIAVAQASVDQAVTGVDNARRNLETVKRIIEQGKKKASLNVDSASAGVDISSYQLSKLAQGARPEEIALANAQLQQASQVLADAQASYDRAKNVADEALNEANQSVNSNYDTYVTMKDIYERTSTKDRDYESVKLNYLQAKAAYDAAVAARNRVSASNSQSLQAAQAQVNSAQKSYDTAYAQYKLATAPARNEDIAIAQSQVRQAQISLEIARIGEDDASFDSQLDQAQAQLDNAISNSQVAIAQLELQKEGPGASDVRAAQAQIDQARASLSLAQAQADEGFLKAPFTGKVAAVNGKPGEIAGIGSLVGDSGGGAVITLINHDRIELSADVDETEVGKLKVDQDVRVMLDAYEDKKFDGKLTGISLISSRNSTGGTVFKVTVVVNPGKVEFREGMSGEIDIVIGSKKNAVIVPFDAVKFDGNKNIVYVIEDGVAHVRRVRIGLSSDTAYEIKSGLKDGEAVAVGKASLTNGQQVKVEKNGRVW